MLPQTLSLSTPLRGEMCVREISLTQGKVALVSHEDYHRVRAHDWCFNGAYAVRGIYKNGKYTTEYMSRFILQTPDDLIADHKRHDKLNNTRSNLRDITQAMNMLHRKNPFAGITPYRGLHRVRVQLNGRVYALGYFASLEEAILARDKKREELFNTAMSNVHKETTDGADTDVAQVTDAIATVDDLA